MPRSYGMTNLLALDPGKCGGIAHLRGGRVHAHPMPATEGDILELLKDLASPPEETTAMIEEVSGFAGRPQPGSAMFKFGRNFGFLIGVLQGHGVRIEFVRPARWQREFSLGTASKCKSPTEWKNRIKAAAQRLHPHLTVTLKTADALMILEYGRRVSASYTNSSEAHSGRVRENVVALSKAAG